ncbi:hypothetical protein [Bergeriella denitrificans]|uniref:Kazal-like domain-containing protein n=1 Tax=Bergeriella denitrificans TaxID=494 RepID=A0A378UKT8_BERDE|nr:hypothetical protein [Bergeriella denitrificans]STZ77313.1 Uncharacterised protein [Bergeriella denitrificans]
MNKILILCTALLLSACLSETKPTAPAQPQAAATDSCRQRFCTREYDPVCATISENGRLHRQTFGNRCTVCSDSGQILSVAKGACHAPAPNTAP